MKLKWQWFLGGRIMFWIALGALVILLFAILAGYVIDPLKLFYATEQNIDPTPIRDVSHAFIASYGIKIDKPVVYRYVKFRCNDGIDDHPAKERLMGTFHEWNGKYYIDISADLSNTSLLTYIVIHETKHMIVQQLKNNKIINLDKYTEAIAQGKDTNLNQLFDNSVYLLKKFQKENEL